MSEAVAKRGRGREPGFRMSPEHRTKIANSQILKCLIKHATGKMEMTPSQVTAGLGLLKKVMPDLNAVTLSGDPDSPIETITRIELIAGSEEDGDGSDQAPA